MRKVFGVTVALWLSIVSAQFADAVTVWYQPTPFPLKKADGTAMPQDINIVHAWTGWLPSLYYGQTFQRDSKLQVGGWGDEYRAFIRLDLTGLPQSVDQAAMYLMPYPRGDSSTPVMYAACSITSSWNLSLTWNTQPSYDPTCYGYATPTPWTWSGFWLSGGGPNWYNQWKSGALANNGVMLFPYATNNNFDTFYSTLYNNYAIDPYADARRPLLGLTFTPPAGMPDFKMPLPGGYKWLLTNEIGGYECKGEAPFPDIAHQDAGSFGNYYSIDISWNNNGSVYGQYNTPVLAAAGGKVVGVGGGNNNGDFNGFYIVIDHDSDGDPNTGFTTRYLHLKQYAARANGTPLAVGNSVNRGDQIGIVGTTGKDTNGNPTSTTEHLHFGVRYQNHGYSYIPELSKVVMEGLILKSYQTECTVDTNGVPTSRIRYYDSTNTPTGN